jgi:hypothetical protein
MITGPPLFANGNTLTASENSKQRQGSDSNATLWIIDISGAFTGTFKVNARALGAGKDGAVAYSGHIAIKDRDTNLDVDGDTGVTTAGIYEVNIAGLEAVLEFTWASGTAVVRDHIVHG